MVASLGRAVRGAGLVGLMVLLGCGGGGGSVADAGVHRDGGPVYPPGYDGQADDGGAADASADAGAGDAGTVDPGTGDAGAGDAGAADAGAADAGAADAGTADAGAADGGTTVGGGGPYLAPPLPGGWSWVNPRPFGEDVRSLWSEPGGTLWVASKRRMLRFDGAAWSAFDVGTTQQLGSVSGRSATDIWAAASRPNVVHWDGAQWTAVQISAETPGALAHTVLAPPGASDLWALAGTFTSGLLMRYAAGEWTTLLSRPGAMTALFAAGAEVWATGWDSATQASFIVRPCSDGLDVTPLPDTFGATAGWAASATDAWVVARNGASSFLHWDGARWTAVPVAPGAHQVESIWGSGSADVYAAGGSVVQHWDGQRWSVVATVANEFFGLRAVTGSSPRDVWVAGDAGLLFHFDGARWTDASPGARPFLLSGVFARAADDVWAVGWGGLALHSDGSVFSVIDAGSADDLTTVWASGASDAWIASVANTGVPHLLRWDGARLTRSADPAVAGLRLSAISGTAANDVWAVSAFPQSPPLHFDGASWSAAQGPSRPWLSVVATSPTDVWALPVYASDDPDRAKVWRFDGRAWTAADTGSSRRIVAIWAIGPNDAWAVDEAAIDALHWDGVRWTSAFLGAGAESVDVPVVHVWGNGPANVWVVRADGWFARWDGARFTPMFVLPGFLGLSGTPAGDLWTVGLAGGVLSLPGAR